MATLKAVQLDRIKLLSDFKANIDKFQVSMRNLKDINLELKHKINVQIDELQGIRTGLDKLKVSTEFM
jgi:hypothetical protein